MSSTPDTSSTSPHWDVFLLAHPDDDIFVRPLLSVDPDVPKAVVFLTNGWRPGLVSPQVRQSEAKRALAELGIANVFWLGIEAGVEVETLAARLDEVDARLHAIASALDGGVRRVVTHAWEGGHPDHDAAHLLGLALAQDLGVLPASLALPFYRAPRSGPWPFVVMRPLAENGASQELALSASQALSLLAGIRHYPSQTKTWAGLLPGLMFQALCTRKLHPQALSSSSAPHRPNTQRLLSEARFGAGFSDFAEIAQRFLEAKRSAAR